MKKRWNYGRTTNFPVYGDRRRLLSGDKGTGKSTMVGILADVLPKIDVVKGSSFNCNPYNELEMCEVCRKRTKKGGMEVGRKKKGKSLRFAFECQR